MKNIKSLFNETDNVEEFSKGYFDYLHSLLKQLDTGAIAGFIGELETVRRNQNTIFFIGNGGSASTASHMANDFSLGSNACDDGLPLRSLALTDNSAVMTAVSNDHGYQNIFIHQLQVHYRPGDKLVAISASGNSPNVVAAAKWVKKQGGLTIGFVGFDGGKLKDICDITIHVKTPKGEYGPVEDIHIILDHLTYTWLWYQKRRKRETEISAAKNG
ncbi:MAG: SIS domain-containing protein [Candidatus Omnitrophota bacterium]